MLQINLLLILYLYFSINVPNDNNVDLASLHFSNPFDSSEHGDSWIPTRSAMASMTAIPKYKNSKAISGIHTMLPNERNTINTVREFLNIK